MRAHLQAVQPAGRGTIKLVGSVWKSLVAGGAVVVIATRAHPNG